MTQDKIIEMARQAGWSKEYLAIGDERLERFANLVAQYEREACAKIFDERDKDIGWYDPGEPAEIIRARGQA